MDIQRAVSLQSLNTFGLPARAEYFAQAQSVEDLKEAVAYAHRRNLPVFLLGGGSNILLTRDIPGLTIHICNTGFEVTKETNQYVWLSAGAGEVWHSLVLQCVEHGLGGIENLSLIPGRMGAAPIQNIGAYGVELKEVFDHLMAVHLPSGEVHTFTTDDCRFGYRDSVFKGKLKGQYAIYSVTLQLKKKPTLQLEYGTIQQTLEEMGIVNPSIKDVSAAVIRIRQSKLPDPNEIGNAGSFFKNPELSIATFENLKQQNPDIPYYPVSSEKMKVPAAWLIEQCGWKGKRIGNTGAHAKQPLVLVNYGNASGDEIQALAKQIQTSVEDRFGISLQPEVNII